MIGKILGAMIGGSIGRKDGVGGTKGAIIGLAAERVVERMGPLGWFLAGVFALWHLIFGRSRRRYR